MMMAEVGRGLNRNRIVLFDGVCNLCNASVNFIIDRDPKATFSFASIQSEFAQQTLAACGRPSSHFDSMVLIEGGRCYTKSTAALRIARELSGWKLLYPLILVPRPIRDFVYDFVARNRYRWFGRAETCRIPTPDMRRRFKA